jgi:putative DNA primase/helicase
MSDNDILSKFKDPIPNGSNSWMTYCPCHEDGKRSLSIKNDNGKWLFKCFAGCATEDIVATVGLAMQDLFPCTERQNQQQSQIASTYDYQDSGGNLQYQVVRMEPKGFRQRRPDHKKPGSWIWDLKGVQPLLYHWPDILIKSITTQETIYVVEGEKDANNLAKLGLVATTNSGGAGKWDDIFSGYLAGANVVILPDNDEPGRRHADAVAESLTGRARSVKVINLPGLPEKGDVSDWLTAGGTGENLKK